MVFGLLGQLAAAAAKGIGKGVAVGAGMEGVDLLSKGIGGILKGIANEGLGLNLKDKKETGIATPDDDKPPFEVSSPRGQPLKIDTRARFDDRSSVKVPTLKTDDFKIEKIRGDDVVKSVDKIHANIINYLNVVNENISVTFVYVRDSVREQDAKIASMRKTTGDIVKIYDDTTRRMTKMDARISDLERRRKGDSGPIARRQARDEKGRFVKTPEGPGEEGGSSFLGSFLGGAATSLLGKRLLGVAPPLAILFGLRETGLLSGTQIGPMFTGPQTEEERKQEILDFQRKQREESTQRRNEGGGGLLGQFFPDYFDKKFGSQSGGPSNPYTDKSPLTMQGVQDAVRGPQRITSDSLKQRLQDKHKKPQADRHEKCQAILMQSQTDLALIAAHNISAKARKITLKAQSILLDAPRITFTSQPKILGGEDDTIPENAKPTSGTFEQSNRYSVGGGGTYEQIGRTRFGAGVGVGGKSGSSSGGDQRRATRFGVGGGVLRSHDDGDPSGGIASGGNSASGGGIASSGGGISSGGGRFGGRGGSGGWESKTGMATREATSGRISTERSSQFGQRQDTAQYLRSRQTPLFGKGGLFSSGGGGGFSGGGGGGFGGRGGTGSWGPGGGGTRRGSGPGTTPAATPTVPRVSTFGPGTEGGGPNRFSNDPARDLPPDKFVPPNPNAPFLGGNDPKITNVKPAPDPNAAPDSSLLDPNQTQLPNLIPPKTPGPEPKPGEVVVPGVSLGEVDKFLAERQVEAGIVGGTVRYDNEYGKSGLGTGPDKGSLDKDAIAAKLYGMTREEYSVRGVDPRVRMEMYEAMRQYEAENPGKRANFTAGFRDDYRQSIATGSVVARPGGSLHGGSDRLPTNQEATDKYGKSMSAYGYGRAMDIAAGHFREWMDKRQNVLKPLAGDPPHVEAREFSEETNRRYREFYKTYGQGSNQQQPPDPNKFWNVPIKTVPVKPTTGGTSPDDIPNNIFFDKSPLDPRNAPPKQPEPGEGRQLLSGATIPKDLDKESLDEINRIARTHGIPPEAIAGVIQTESEWNTRSTSPGGKYRGLTQIGPEIPGYEGIGDKSRADNIRAYEAYLNHYNIPAKLKAAGVDLSKLSSADAAAVMQGFQFAPNHPSGGKSTPPEWLTRFAAGDRTTPVTDKPQAGSLGDTSIDSMSRKTANDFKASPPVFVPKPPAAAPGTPGTPGTTTQQTTTQQAPAVFPGTVDLTTRNGQPTMDFERLGPTEKGREKGTTSGPMEGPAKGIIFHHTEGNSVEGAIGGMNERRNAVQYIIGLDKDGNAQVYQTLPTGHKGSHISTDELPKTGPYSSAPGGLGIHNKNTIGIELVGHEGKIDPRIIAKAKEFGLWLMKTNPTAVVLGHGDVNPRNKEGKDISTWLRENANKPQAPTVPGQQTQDQSSPPGTVISDAVPDPLRAGQQYAGLTTTQKTPDAIPPTTQTITPAPTRVTDDNYNVITSPQETTQTFTKPGQAAPAPKTKAELDTMLGQLAKGHKEKLAYKSSVVDLMKVLGWDSSKDARQKLAISLGFKGKPGSASQNIFLQKVIRDRLIKPVEDTTQEGVDKGKRLDRDTFDDRFNPPGAPLDITYKPPGAPLDITSDAQKADTFDQRFGFPNLPDAVPTTAVSPTEATQITPDTTEAVIPQQVTAAEIPKEVPQEIPKETPATIPDQATDLANPQGLPPVMEDEVPRDPISTGARKRDLGDDPLVGQEGLPTGTAKPQDGIVKRQDQFAVSKEPRPLQVWDGQRWRNTTPEQIVKEYAAKQQRENVFYNQAIAVSALDKIKKVEAPTPVTTEPTFDQRFRGMDPKEADAARVEKIKQEKDIEVKREKERADKAEKDEDETKQKKKDDEEAPEKKPQQEKMKTNSNPERETPGPGDNGYAKDDYTNTEDKSEE